MVELTLIMTVVLGGLSICFFLRGSWLASELETLRTVNSESAERIIDLTTQLKQALEANSISAKHRIEFDRVLRAYLKRRDLWDDFRIELKIEGLEPSD